MFLGMEHVKLDVDDKKEKKHAVYNRKLGSFERLE